MLVAALILDKIDFKTKSGTKKHKGDYIMIKESIQEDDIQFIDICAPNI